MDMEIIKVIAIGMRRLHKDNIIHQDLKAANMLLKPLCNDFNPMTDKFQCQVADFECCVGVVGTTFRRSPEMLQAVKEHNIPSEIFMKIANVFCFGMTCYEILTGRIPFEDLGRSNYDVVLQGHRPELPRTISTWITDC